MQQKCESRLGGAALGFLLQMCTILGRRGVPAVPKSRGGNDLHPCHGRLITRMPSDGKRQICGSDDRRIVRIQRAQQIVVALRRIAAATARAVRRSACRASPRAGRSAESSRAPPPADARCAPARARRRPRGLPPTPAADVPPAAPTGRPGRRAASRGNARTGQDVADRADILRRRGAHLRLGARAAERRGVAGGIQHRDLPPLRMRRGGDQRIQRLLRRAAGAQQRKPAWPQPRIGAMLRQHRADAGRAIGARARRPRSRMWPQRRRSGRCEGSGRRGRRSWVADVALC